MAILVFGVGQLVLPPLAAHIARQRLAKDGTVLSVSVSAFPAIELLFGDVGSVKVKMASFTAPETQVAAKMSQAAHIANLDMTIGTVKSGPVTINSVHVTKHHGVFSGTGVITQAGLQGVAPGLLKTVIPVGSSNGQVTLQATSDPLPFIGSITADATVTPQDGRVVVAATGLLGTVLHLTVWSNPKVYVESLAGAKAPQGIALSAKWRLG